ncbi:hypothetical protein BCR39DRAFT_116958 [Naematelia encephala]|uniref:Gylcosyl hydrolase 115 C-terminal domain-containing protein n=1 Tax=Naematelia encephala TaxID=71784 RepID=A0A1Y2BIH3_9TREE|nr:hypothetical protein BCR39DRAFT_116958 [Naematelia encephala]
MLIKATTVLLAAQAVLALGGEQCITFPKGRHHHASPLTRLASTAWDYAQSLLSPPPRTSDTFIIADRTKHTVLPIVTSSDDDVAIHLAVANFVEDIHRVTGLRPKVFNDTLPRKTERAIVVGSVDSGLVTAQPFGYTENMKGRWEVWDARVVKGSGIKGVKEALVLTGSDRRGTIYALYTLSEQMGVSPWYWWADVPTHSHPIVAFDASKICSHGEPTIKYRGLFINDELPVLFNWAHEKFGIPANEPPFQVGMYEKVFELLLRLRANYMWPAMWASMFSVDGEDVSHGFPQPPHPGPNQVLANNMGIVMGTSHHEPMGRNKQEWDYEGQGPWDWTNKDRLEDWWTYGAERAKGMETLFTMGMRGDGDSPLTGASKELLEEITDTQRGILGKVYNTSDVSTIPQMWCMYKEVQGYFQAGLKVPSDVIAMLADDNWGNIMTVPPASWDHPAGAGLYYHAEYVGVPRDYKWINTISLAKMWEQLNIARTFQVDQLWVLNVGDLKLLETPLDYFLTLAYDWDEWPRNSLTSWLTAWATRDFGAEYADEVAWTYATFARYVSRIKPELINSTIWSLENYEEAERLLEDWTELEDRSEAVYRKMPKAAGIAYFELLHAEIKLVANLNRMYIAVGKNNLYSDQARTSTNFWAEKAIELFQNDRKITQEYHELYDGRWDHMLDQTHINFNWFLEPQRNTMPPVNFIETFLPSRPSREANPPGLPAYIRVSPENSRGAWPGISPYNCDGRFDCWSPTVLKMDPYGAPTRWVDLSSGGPKDVTFQTIGNETWLSASPSHGRIRRDGSTDQRIYISVDWDQVPNPVDGVPFNGTAELLIATSDGSNVTVFVPVVKPEPVPKDYTGHIEGDGYISIEASHVSRNTSVDGYAFEELDWYGRTLSGMEMFPVSEVNFTVGQGPSLSYDFYTTGASFFSASNEEGQVHVTVQIGPTNNFILNKKLAFGVQLDDDEPVLITPIPDSVELEHAGTLPVDWNDIVAHEIRNVELDFELAGGNSKGGKHTLTIWGVTSGIVLERILVDLGGIERRGWSYLGPPESLRV